ncbi:MAG: hypothetical protein KDE04_09160 [Anaerolineales bacterium]|nr:hypothetical protein [Anaerolineales bacterium]
MLSELQTQIEALAQQFAPDDAAMADLMRSMVADVRRAVAEPLEIFPVAHHSPAAALQLVRRLQADPPRVIFIEMCEDLRGLVPDLASCKLPVALQAFASRSDLVEATEWPAIIIAPLTEASAEFQAIAYCQQHPETELVFVDQPVDHFLAWQARQKDRPVPNSEPPEEAELLHGKSIAVCSGDVEPTLALFIEHLLRHSNTRHFAEWWEMYVERTVIQADSDGYKQILYLLGSLIRRLGRRQVDLEQDEARERHMWRRIKQHLQATRIQPEQAIYICGAVHAASDVPEFGTQNDQHGSELPAPSQTAWLYGLIPSSYRAIEYQFGNPPGTVALAAASWQKNMRAAGLRPFHAGKQKRSGKAARRPMANRPDSLATILNKSPQSGAEDKKQLLDWSVRLVALARRNGYLASTADSIAIYQSAIWLANLRNRHHPSAYDFTDAAVTCLEKDRTPKKRTVAQLCAILLGGDRIGTIGYQSLPPLARDIYDRLAPLPIDLYARTNQRALLDLTTSPELIDCSELLWRLNFLLGDQVVQPIVGERTLDHAPIQESWEVRIGKQQGAVIQLGYEGVTIEQVLEARMRQRLYQEKTTAAAAIGIVKASLLYLQAPRLTSELGQQAIELLTQETSATNADRLFEQARELVQYYRRQPDGLPTWLSSFVATGYAHYCALLPHALTDPGTTPAEVSGMLNFIFTLESLALSLGCSRTQLAISLQQCREQAMQPEKLGLFWTSEWLVGQRPIASIRAHLADISNQPRQLSQLPAYLTGFLLGLEFAPQMGRFVVEIVSQIFATVPDERLIPWLPSLILQLRQVRATVPGLLKEAAVVFPTRLSELPHWQPQWLEDKVENEGETALPVDEEIEIVRELLEMHPSTLHYWQQFLL